VIDDDGSNSFDLIGVCETTLGTIMGAKQQTFTGNLHIPSDKKSRGMLIVRAEGLEASNTAIKFHIAAEQLSNIQGGCLGMCGEIAPVWYELQRGTPGGQFVTVYKSET
jgi:hypothetical protein